MTSAFWVYASGGISLITGTVSEHTHYPIDIIIISSKENIYNIMAF